MDLLRPTDANGFRENFQKQYPTLIHKLQDYTTFRGSEDGMFQKTGWQMVQKQDDGYSAVPENHTHKKKKSEGKCFRKCKSENRIFQVNVFCVTLTTIGNHYMQTLIYMP